MGWTEDIIRIRNRNMAIIYSFNLRDELVVGVPYAQLLIGVEHVRIFGFDGH